MKTITKDTLLPLGFTILIVSGVIAFTSWLNTIYLTGEANAKVSNDTKDKVEKMEYRQQEVNSVLLEKVSKIEARTEYIVKQLEKR
ncbi:MAG: hypothetical protein BWZ03_00084 [bacterium ADurb.BinA186]|nr:MAG: hypothetical protein BWZ03_00084 [bacterium ADurb.BinA186]